MFKMLLILLFLRVSCSEFANVQYRVLPISQRSREMGSQRVAVQEEGSCAKKDNMAKKEDIFDKKSEGQLNKKNDIHTLFSPCLNDFALCSCTLGILLKKQFLPLWRELIVRIRINRINKINRILE